MRVEDFQKLIFLTAQRTFPGASILLSVKRDIALEARIEISENTFVEVYYNSLTNKKSLSLIKEDKRIMGYDNYKYWHVHPANNVTAHVPCQEPSIEKVFEEMKELIITIL